ncbi:hypothetical protein XENOCAPTIV_004332 [Xenoophorus captivus]|uniref:EF-hand domain-containing protein n=1 Tax=Xenoophorus captivus TaxID=1517983 RepID=A0ABV0Q7Z7_9TELE
MDLDGDGVLSMYELEYFYEEQCQKLEALSIEPLPFEDCLCQMLDLVKPEVEGQCGFTFIHIAPCLADSTVALLSGRCTGAFSGQIIDHRLRERFTDERTNWAVCGQLLCHPHCKITLRDLKKCKLAHIFFDTFFNIEKYLDHEQRDPFSVIRVRKM